MESAKKESLRETIREARPQSSQGLTQQLIRLCYELNAETIISYWPLGSEPDVSDFNNWVELVGKSLITPRVLGQDLEFAQGPCVPGTFGILEPTGAPRSIFEADLVLVPALAIDSLGNRLGKGRGFYDRSLVGLTAPTYGVIFDSEFLAEIPAEEHDVRLDGAVTPTAIRHLFVG